MTLLRFIVAATPIFLGLIGATPPMSDVPLPELNQKVVAFARDQLGKKVGDGSCSTLAVYALRQAGAQAFPFDGSNGDFVWGTEVKSSSDALPGDIVQFRDIVFKGRKNLPGGRWISWMNTFPHHTAVVAGVRNGGKIVAILHQNVGPQDADDSVKKIVQEGTLRMVELQKGGSMRFFRPVAKPSGTARAGELKSVLFEGDFPRTFGAEWTWIGENAVSWRVDGGALVLRPARSADGTTKSRAETLLLYTLPGSRDSLYTIDATLARRPLSSPGQAGLVCYFDDDHQVRVVTESSEGKAFVQFTGNREANSRVPLARGTSQTAPVQLRLLIWSGVITAQFRTDPDEFWQTLGRCTAPGRGAAKVGVVWTQAANRTADEIHISDFRIARQSNMGPR